MKRRYMFLEVLVFALMFMSCKNSNEQVARKSINNYMVYVDSLENLPEEEIEANWEKIDSNYQIRFVNAEIALENLKEIDKNEEEQKMEERKTTFYTLKARLDAKREAFNSTVNSKQKMRNALLDLEEIGRDIDFGWVNTFNIHDVYLYFVTVVENNKEDYSREDWEEIKAIYEALDNRRNTIEIEGLSPYDKKQIAALKFRFMSIYHIYKIRTKSTEMDKAKG